MVLGVGNVAELWIQISSARKNETTTKRYSLKRIEKRHGTGIKKKTSIVEAQPCAHMPHSALFLPLQINLKASGKNGRTKKEYYYI